MATAVEQLKHQALPKQSRWERYRHFTAAEARELVGCQVEARQLRTGRLDVSRGTNGVVRKAEQYRENEWDLVVEWPGILVHHDRKLVPLEDRFPRHEFLIYCRVLNGRSK